MLRINKLADYGTVVMVFLAHHGEGLASARDIAAYTHLGLPTVSKVLKRLTAAGLLISVRGSAGGYRLKHQASDISVANILYALDESRGLTECSLEPDACALHHVCHVQDNWRLMSQTIEAALESVSLEALAKPVIPAENLNKMKQVMMGVNRVESA
ncbi:MAG: SUF system Fe-S cluster assembly regulator [Gammaproteobacteria bacterium]|nr:SUF system Fe-S cluster assembly regulator [Gammaproteobacteria bacterium]